MNEKTLEAYRPELDPKMMRYWMRQGPKAAAFLLVIPGCTVIGYGAGLLSTHSLPCGVNRLWRRPFDLEIDRFL